MVSYQKLVDDMFSNPDDVEELTQNFTALLEQLTVGAAIKAVGTIKNSPGKEQGVEMHASAITLVGACPTTFPLQKKRHSFDFSSGVGSKWGIKSLFMFLLYFSETPSM